MTDPESVLCTGCDGTGTSVAIDDSDPRRPIVSVPCEPCAGTGRHAPLPPCQAEHPGGRGRCIRRNRHLYHQVEEKRTGATYHATDVWLWPSW